jgi:uncharacterized repeat protein (TIGR01451 family)
VTDSCGYPIGTTGRAGTIFNESTVLKGFQLYGTGSATRIAAFYSDEHALTLGKDPGVAPFTPSGANTFDDVSGNPVATGDPNAVDPSDRPLYPALFLTDITNNPGSTSGDWQNQANNSSALGPNAVAGTWKSSGAADPAKNNWDLGPTADAVPAGLQNEGYGAEVVWNASSIGAQSGHTYRVQFMVHDGDQNKEGGDVGEACATFTIPPVNLSIEKHADSNFVEVGQQVGFRVTVTGSGPAKAVVLNDPLPSGPALNTLNWTLDGGATGDVHPSCSITGTVGHQTLHCDAVDLGSQSSSQSYSVHVLSATSASGPGFTIKNIATASASNHGDVVDDDTAAGDTNPTGPGTGNTIIVSALSIEKHADANEVQVGNQVGYLITVKGSGPAKDVVLDDALPPGPAGNRLNWSIDAIGGDVHPTCSITGAVGAQTLHCNAVNLGSGADFSVPQSYQVHVVSPTRSDGPGFTITNIAVATSSNHSPVKDDDTTVGDTQPFAPGAGNSINVVTQLVLGARVTPGTANLLGPTGCVTRAFNARVKGTKIARVVFRLDGKKVKTLTKPNLNGTFALRVNPASLRIGVHRLLVTVSFTSASGTKTKTIRLSFQRCKKKLQAPRFTG